MDCRSASQPDDGSPSVVLPRLRCECDHNTADSCVIVYLRAFDEGPFWTGLTRLSTGLFQLDLQGSALSESATLTNGIYESINVSTAL